MEKKTTTTKAGTNPQEARTATVAGRDDARDARYRRLREDDLETWAETGGDLSLWSRHWNEEPTPGGARNPLFIPREVRPYYFRSAERDAEVMRAWPADRQETPDADVYGEVLAVDGFPVTLTGRDPELTCHWYAMRQARARIKVENAERGRRVVDATRTCEICGRVGADVAYRSLGNLTTTPGAYGPRWCDACHAVAVEDVEARRRVRAETSGSEILTDGTTRSDRVKVWIDGQAGRIL